MSTRDPVHKAFQCLTYMVESGDSSWSVRKLAAAFELPASTMHRTLTALCEVGLLKRNPDTQLYELGDDLHRLARRVVTAFPLPEIARPHLQALTQEAGETTLLGVHDAARGRMMFSLQAEGTHPLRYVVPLYTWVPLHLGASGLAILAFLDPEDQQRVLSEVERDEGADAVARVNQEIEIVRQRGYAVSHGQRIPGAIGIAAPVFGPDRKVLADVLLTVPETRFHPEDESRYVDLVRQCAQRLNGLVGA